MKKLKRILLLLCLFCLLLPPLCAHAEEKSAAERGLEAIRTAKNRDCIVLPEEESYLESFKTLYGRRAWYAPSLFVESLPMQRSGVPNQPSLYEGTQVTVVAEENDMSCILYRSVDYNLYAGWIPSIRLLEDFPGELYTIGEEREGDFRTVQEVGQHWSPGYLPMTERHYTVLDEKICGCIGFTLEYQMIAENTSRKMMLFGPRTVWVSDGENWTALGCFPYWENGTVRVKVWMDEPMDIAEIATVAHCYAPNMFDFRQEGRDFLLTAEEK